MKKHIAKIMMLFALPAVAMVSCDNFERTEVVPTITVDHSVITLFAGETMQLTASPATLDFTWSSTNEDIASVDNNGLVTAIAEGAASIIAQSGDMTFETEVIVQIEVPMENVEFRDKGGFEISKGATMTVNVDTAPYDANDIALDDFAWSTGDENIARISDAGVLKGINYGVTTLYYRRGHFNIEAQVNVGKSFPHTKGAPFVLSKDAPANWMFNAWDRGGRGGGYEDKSGRNGNTPDVEGSGNIGYTTNGEWLCYTIDVKDAGTYKCTVTASSSAGKGSWGGNYQWYIDEPNVAEAACSPAFQLQSGGAWGGPWMPAEVEVTLEAGVQRLIFYMHNGAHNLWDITFEYAE